MAVFALSEAVEVGSGMSTSRDGRSVRRVRTTRKLKRQHMLWMLLTILVLATASQAPVISLIHRQLGTRHSLKAVLGGQPALPGPGLAAPDRDVDLISAAYHLQEANAPLELRRSRLSKSPTRLIFTRRPRSRRLRSRPERLSLFLGREGL